MQKIKVENPIVELEKTFFEHKKALTMKSDTLSKVRIVFGLIQS
jgi:hypothetical protein